MARVYKATVRCHYDDGTLFEPGFHYQTDVPLGGSEPDPDDVANDVWNQLGFPMKNAAISGITFDELVVVEQVVPPAIGASGVHVIGGTGNLAAAGEPLPRELVPIILWHTATRSRSARGHTFLSSPGDSNALTTGQKWSTSALGLYQAVAAAGQLSFDLGSEQITHVHPVVYSRTRHSRGQSPFAFPITGATAKDHPTWLRSRHTSP